MDHSSFHFGKNLSFLTDAINVLKEKNPLPFLLESEIIECKYSDELWMAAEIYDFQLTKESDQKYKKLGRAIM